MPERFALPLWTVRHSVQAAGRSEYREIPSRRLPMISTDCLFSLSVADHLDGDRRCRDDETFWFAGGFRLVRKQSGQVWRQVLVNRIAGRNPIVSWFRPVGIVDVILLRIQRTYCASKSSSRLDDWLRRGDRVYRKARLKLQPGDRRSRKSDSAETADDRRLRCLTEPTCR